MRFISRVLIAISCSMLALPAFSQGGSWPVKILQKTFSITQQSQIDVPLNEMHQGCARRDCIPAIDTPNFVSAENMRNLDDGDLVLGLDYAGVVRAYPVFILNRHEVVNDTLNGVPIAVTFCPLCGSGVAFQRELNGEAVEFGVSGLLHNSDLILYDRATESLWQQITGTAIAGPQRGATLTAVPLAMATWSDWFAAHPDTTVLSGERRMSYSNKTPYGDYDSSDRLMFPANSAAAKILHPKQVVHGVRIAEGAVAVTERAFDASAEIETQVGDVTLTWQRKADGSVVVRRAGSDEELLPRRMFWFAWYSFNTDTILRDRDRT